MNQYLCLFLSKLKEQKCRIGQFMSDNVSLLASLNRRMSLNICILMLLLLEYCISQLSDIAFLSQRRSYARFTA